MFCACSTSEVLLCVYCVGRHLLKRTGRPHITWTIDQRPYYKIQGYAERLQMRLEHFPHVRMQALQQVTCVDKAIQEFTSEIEKAICELEMYRNATLDELNKVKTELGKEIEAALEEVEGTLVQDQPRLTTRYAPLFWAQAEQLQSFELFSYSLKAFPPQTMVALDFQLHSSLFFQTNLFAAVLGEKLEIYDLNTQQTSRHTLTQAVFGGCIPLDRETLLFVGEEVMTLDLLTFQTTTQAPLLSPRIWPGIAKVGNDVFAFGGQNSDLKILTVCEKWNLQDKRWTRLRNMHHARNCFTPCHFNSLIYLVSTIVKDHRAVEVFNPGTETFKVLLIPLPAQLVLGCCSVAFVANGELCLLTNNKQKACWKIESECDFRLSYTSRKYWSNQQPRIVGTQVLIACNGRVVKLNLELYNFI